jgi:hypothetical protein
MERANRRRARHRHQVRAFSGADAEGQADWTKAPEATNRSGFDASIQYRGIRSRHIGGMKSIDLSDVTPRPRGSGAVPPRCPAPCAGLFGWRKDAALPMPSGEPSRKPGPDYPAG